MVTKIIAAILSFWSSLKTQVYFTRTNYWYVIEDWIMKNVNKTELIKSSGKTLLITGGTRGLGIDVIKKLLECDFQIVVGCRKPATAIKLLENARYQCIFKGNIESYELDTSSLESVRVFAEVIKKKYSKIDVLVNNAGIMNAPYKETSDGFESIFATNYLGHALLTHLLLPLVAAAGTKDQNSRIVNVASCAHFNGRINFKDINDKNKFTYTKAYSQSKVAQVLYTLHLDKELKKRNCPIDVLSVHPGICYTEIFDGTFMRHFRLLFKSSEEGAIPIVHTCISPYLNNRGGAYVTNCRTKKPSKYTQSEELQEQFFQFTNDLLKIQDYYEYLK